MINNLKNKKKKGFTLIELIIVIAIIAILAVIAIPKFGAVRKNANASADIANAKQIQNAVSIVIADGTVELPTADLTFVFDGTADTLDTTGIEVAVKEQLQEAIPTLKAIEKGDNFKVKVTTLGKTTVTTEAGVAVYPNGEEVYVEN